MKKIFFASILSAVLVIASVPAFAGYTGGMLSPALSVISEKIVMVKAGLISGDITFSEDDFTKAVGADIDSITITSTPLRTDGVLTYNGTEVAVNQTISSSSLSKLKYTPTGSSKTGSFRFKSSGDYSTECILRYTDTINIAPSAAKTEDDVTAWTQTDIKMYGTLAGYDPDGDDITFEITKYATKGVVELVDDIGGGYTYTPCDGMKGKDTFSYVVRDEWGHYSEEATVVVQIDKVATELVFDDMDGHWAHNAALVMAAEGAIEPVISDGKVCFMPDEMITREDFIVSVMKILGAGEIEPRETVFADNSDISPEASGYIARAYSLGVINGIEKNGKIYFEPTASITRSDAAVILNKIIGAVEPDTYPVFADGDSVPTYARGALYALTSAGVFRGNGIGMISPNETLSRAQAAQIMLTVKKLYT